MSLTPIEQQPETILSDTRLDYPQRFNLMDLLGLTDDLAGTTPRPGTFDPPENDNLCQPVVDWTLIGKR